MFPTAVKPGTTNTINWGAYTPTTSLAPKPAAQTTFSTPLTSLAAPKPAAAAPTQPAFSTPLTSIAAPKAATAPAPAPVAQTPNINLQSYFPQQTAQVQPASSGAPQTPAIATAAPTDNPAAPAQQPPQYSPTSVIGQTPNFGSYVQGEAGAAAGAIPIGQNANAIAKQYQDLINPMLGEQVGERTTGTYPVGEGNAAAIGQEIQGLSAQEGQALSANAQGLTAEQQAQQGLGAAAGQIQPQLGPIGTQGYYNPLNPSAGSTGGNAFQGGVVQGQQALGANYAGMNAANTAAKGIQSQVVNYLQSNPTLNPSDLTFANSMLQWASGQQLGDPRYQTLSNLLNEYISTLAPILGVGGDTTNLKTQIAQSFINAKASGQSISDVLNNIGQIADQKLSNIASAGQGGGAVTGGNVGPTTESVWSF